MHHGGYYVVYDVVVMLQGWIFCQDSARDAYYYSEVAALDLRVKEYRYAGLYVGHAGMLVNSCYKHYGYVYAFHFIVVMVTCMIDVSWLVRSYVHVSNSHEW